MCFGICTAMRVKLLTEMQKGYCGRISLSVLVTASAEHFANNCLGSVVREVLNIVDTNTGCYVKEAFTVRRGTWKSHFPRSRRCIVCSSMLPFSGLRWLIYQCLPKAPLNIASDRKCCGTKIRLAGNITCMRWRNNDFPSTS